MHSHQWRLLLLKGLVLLPILLTFCIFLQGDKNLIKFEGDHNSPRPQFYYDSVSIFFYNVLHPPQFPSTCSDKFDKYYNLGAFKGGPGTNEVFFLFISVWNLLPCVVRSSPSRLPIHLLEFSELIVWDHQWSTGSRHWCRQFISCYN